ncbi:Ferredoxin--NADP reductase [Gemmata obscuriglobus]|uniref:ferredoxin--NADP(+) reductase n=1 Tax=Gemmata obscuriglobus TaxID=114 RepID=A0A2Z3HAC4_9BACT|nr:ferredoxin--NADP reductase [Gemmata obscuriglobus]AWM38080.1 ferredoxin--NADP reductase [Gemmata obscuriglobus]QEG29042.1 Ferredoxin--NADP reductase [Gemmata obscuriglobus]VTS07659.1 ferredoxin--nadp reductase : Probable ferredoxin--NADP reductase OS=Planctomyces maris DSM 8797 GN=PM8797T_00487 PE=4 SV=1: NAD_binding_1 [Gemmata obscuriglobus UQM 2246]
MTAEDIASLRQRRYNATVVSLRLVNPDLMILRVKPDAPRPEHRPGQYCTLGLGYWERRTEGCQAESLSEGDFTKVVRRAYSLSCGILDDDGDLLRLEDSDWLEFYIVLVRENPDGRVPALTPRLFALSEGDRIYLGDRVTGHYTLDPVRPCDTVLFLGTGTGEAPHNYMTWELLSRRHTGKIVNVCCVRYARDLGYHNTHQLLAQKFPNYSYIPLTTRELGNTRKLYIQDLVQSGELERHLGTELDPATTHVFLCGNPRMIGVPVHDRDSGEVRYPSPVGTVEILEARGFTADVAARKLKGNVHFEEYW